MSNISPIGTRLSRTIDEFSEASGICRSTLYQAIRSGELIAKKRGRNTLILEEDGRAYLKGLPQMRTASKTAA
ncbi:MAG: hypothetical protein NVS2B5_05710 [Beijerinckiaceae bacterium]